MAETEILTFSEAVRRAGVSRQRLNRAIQLGHLPAQRGGGPGRLTRIRLDDLQAWCQGQGLAVPVESQAHLERAETSLPTVDLTALMAHLERQVEQAVTRAVDAMLSQ